MDGSPAQDLAARTISELTFGVVPAAVAVPVLAGWESLVGLGLLTGLIAAAMVVGATARGGQLRAEPSRGGRALAVDGGLSGVKLAPRR